MGHHAKRYFMLKRCCEAMADVPKSAIPAENDDFYLWRMLGGGSDSGERSTALLLYHPRFLCDNARPLRACLRSRGSGENGDN